MPATEVQTTPVVAPAAFNWRLYLMEGVGLGVFMLSASIFATLLEHPASLAHQLVEAGWIRRVLMGIAMGATAVAIICSPWGKRSGAHLNPAVTLTYLALGKVARWDGLFYVISQFAGAIAGMRVAEILIGSPLRHSAVNYVVTAPGPVGVSAAFVAELAISLLLMMAVLVASNNTGLARFTPLVAGAMVAAFISVEAPISGMSMNPARTFGSAFAAGDWTALWVYFTAPPLGMMLAAFLYAFRHGPNAIYCAKLHHTNGEPCIFRCRFAELGARH